MSVSVSVSVSVSYNIIGTYACFGGGAMIGIGLHSHSVWLSNVKVSTKGGCGFTKGSGELWSTPNNCIRKEQTGIITLCTDIIYETPQFMWGHTLQFHNLSKLQLKIRSPYNTHSRSNQTTSIYS